MISEQKYITFAPEYKRLWGTMRIIRDTTQLQRLSDKIKKHRAVYERVEKDTGVPWQMVAVIHVREAGEQDIGRWTGVLHNGEDIVGTGRVTRLVPANRGPFSTWHESAVDALTMPGKNFDKIKEWPIERVLAELEPFNGYGYRNKGLRSPYIWASTNHQQLGKYVRDGVFDPTVMDSQIGCAALLKYLEFGGKSRVNIPPEAGPVVVGTGLAVAFPEYLPYIIAAGILIAAGIFIYRKFIKGNK
jgi:lysozyme family protein